jgi:hypothetical protein
MNETVTSIDSAPTNVATDKYKRCHPLDGTLLLVRSLLIQTVPPTYQHMKSIPSRPIASGGLSIPATDGTLRTAQTVPPTFKNTQTALGTEEEHPHPKYLSDSV